jgi:predicted O-methyltransferase YrrM
MPVHYYSPIPNTRRLPDTLWERESELRGVDVDEAPQLALLRRFAERYRSEYDSFPRAPTAGDDFFLDNGYFMTSDAEVLYCMVRDQRPRRVVEVGSGFSTLLTSLALQRNLRDGHPGSLTCIEPYPAFEWLRQGSRAPDRLIETHVQLVPPAIFEELEANDILFIDSTHVVAIGSDVVHEFLEVLPRLRPGVLVHVHDIFLPREVHRRWIKEDRWFWNEQYLLHAFLLFNREFEVLWTGHLMHVRHPDELRRAFRSYADQQDAGWGALPGPASFWMRRRFQ